MAESASRLAGCITTIRGFYRVDQGLAAIWSVAKGRAWTDREEP